MLLTHENHLQFGWGGKTFNFQSQELPLWLMFERHEEVLGNFKEECLNCVRLIGEKNKNVYLCLSGGIDSEVVARCFLELEIPFTALIMRFEDDKNLYDIKMAFEFCMKNKIPRVIYPLNFQYFVEEAAADETYITNNLFNFLQMKLLNFIKKNDGFGVIASGEIRPFLEDNKIYSKFSNKNTSIYHWLSETETKAVPAFFLHTSGIIRSYFKEPIFENLKRIRNEFPISPLGHNIKTSIYKKYWPELESREKYSGFEKFRAERYQFKLVKNKQYGAKIQEISFSMGNDLDFFEKICFNLKM